MERWREMDDGGASRMRATEGQEECNRRARGGQEEGEGE
jgi:hypothetical protein